MLMLLINTKTGGIEAARATPFETEAECVAALGQYNGAVDGEHRIMAACVKPDIGTKI